MLALKKVSHPRATSSNQSELKNVSDSLDKRSPFESLCGKERPRFIVIKMPNHL